jgi:hypothetical protein
MGAYFIYCSFGGTVVLSINLFGKSIEHRMPSVEDELKCHIQPKILLLGSMEVSKLTRKNVLVGS